MLASIIALIVLILFIYVILNIFLPAILQIFVNIVIIWLVGTRSYVEIVREQKEKYYAFGLLGASVFILFWGFRTWHNIWWITVFVVIMFVIAQNYIILEDKSRHKTIKKSWHNIKKKIKKD